METNYPSNSNKSKETVPAKKLDSVVSAPAVPRKKKKEKFLPVIFEQDFNDIKLGLYNEWIKPKIRAYAWSLFEGMIDTVKNTIRMMMYENYKPSESKPANNGYSYSSIYNSNQNPTMSKPKEISYDEFQYPTYGEAERVRRGLIEQIERCKVATVLDMYQLSQVDTSNYTLQDWGWTNLDFAEIKQIPEAESPNGFVYIITMPKAKPLPR